ncbi:hypothetical protein [Amycolatopsis sp.]|uniref:hypothetical protein n=1 Tax=Amycolatopsis sp. TaxID=37632 RepID=UPI002C5725B8|nr:hypothetical protein [Amycolatopsis sp.]HVV10554.1 hypothetical protein [Amycolatopsis sp.]
MNQPVETVVLPVPHRIAAGGPEWTYRAVFGDRIRITGLVAVSNTRTRYTSAAVALNTREDSDPYGEAALFLSPLTARAVAAALLAATIHAEGGEPR